MKKWNVIVLAIVGMLSMVGCSNTEKTAERMCIEPAQLTEEEDFKAICKNGAYIAAEDDTHYLMRIKK